MIRLTRRRFTQTLAGGLAAGSLPRGAWAEPMAELVAIEATARIALPEMPETAVWGYGGSVPGGTIRVPQGARISRRFVNRLPQPSSVHWHGIRIDNAMDGVAGLTQDAVAPGATFDYDFIVPDAGTYWYHPHNRTWEQMARGLYGALIVDEAQGAPEVDHDEALMIDDWRLAQDGQITDDFGAMHDWAHAGRIGNWVTVNGNGRWTRPAMTNQRMRLRLVNAANARIFALEAIGLEGWVVALDGMPLETPEPFGRLVLAPAQRADIVADVTAGDGEEAFLVSFEQDGGYALASFPVAGAARPVRLPPPVPLPANPVPPLGLLATAREVPLRMEGGAMGGMRGAMLNGQQMDMQALVGAGMVWAFNGMAGMPEAPLLEAARGETVQITMTNDSVWPHAMHLHGHHFRRIAADGTPGPLRDTLLVDGAETARIALVADNPGDWLLHCHMLEHAASGMMTWLRVT